MSQSEHIATLQQTVARYGQPQTMSNFLSRIMCVESASNRFAKNDKSTATGLFQFIESTWNQYGRGGNIYDPTAQCDAVVRFTMDNAKVLKAVLGREPNEGEYYLAHFAGPEGARKILTASPHTSVASLLGGEVIKKNAPIRFRGKSFADFTAGDLQEWAATRMNVDIDARQLYASRRKNGKTNAQEDAEELAIRRRSLQSFGFDAALADKLGDLGILGDLFFAIIKFFMDESAPASERGQYAATRNENLAMRSVQKVQATIPSASRLS
jgi:hypothetical protein